MREKNVSKIGNTQSLFSLSALRIARSPNVADTMPVIGTTQQIATSTWRRVMA